MRYKILLCVMLLCSVCGVCTGRTVLKGVVTDSVSGETLPYASILIVGTSTGCTTDAEGQYSLTLPNRTVTLQISFIGYGTLQVKVTPRGGQMNMNFALMPDGVTLQGVTIKPKKEKYRKRGNPAVEFVRHVIDNRKAGDPRQHDYYSYDHYEKMVFAKNDYTPKKRKNGKKKKIDFVAEFIDTLDNGVTILPVSEKEKMQKVYYRKSPKSEKRVISGFRSSGIDEIFSSDGVQKFLGEVFREVDIFKNDVPLFLQRFVSPLSTIGPNYYKYYLLDTLQVAGTKCVDLGFVPFNSETFGFSGHLYVSLDSTYFVKKAILNVPKDINLNFVSFLKIEQEFERTTDGTRLQTKDDISVNFKLTERTKGMYARRLCVYSNQSFSPPAQAEVFKQSAPEITLRGARSKTDEYWDEHRPAEAVGRNKNSTEKFMAHLKSIPFYRISFKVLSTLVSGYIPTHPEPEKSLFEFGPMNSTVNYNTLEGTRFRVGGTTTTAFNRHLFLDGYVAYGVKDKKMKYDGLIEYSFNDRKEFRKEFPIHSLRFEYMYDINKLGQSYMYTSKDNMVLMIRRKKDDYITYLRQAELTYYREQYSGVAYGAVLRNRREYSTPCTVFERLSTTTSQAQGLAGQADKSSPYSGGLTTSQPNDLITSRPIDHYDMTQLELKFRYAKNEKFYQTRNIRVPITFDALILNVNHTMGLKHFLGSDYNYQHTEVGMQKRFWLSAFGYIDIIAKAGKVWTKAPYPLLILPNANLTYTVQPESYTNMNALEFINDEYTSWDVTYYMNGNLLNRLPLIKKLKWREVFCFRGLWGHLTDKNNPEKNPDGLFRFPEVTHLMSNTPYMEASVGIENIFKFLRIDYAWRLTYRQNPGIQRHGVRMTMALSF